MVASVGPASTRRSRHTSPHRHESIQRGVEGLYVVERAASRSGGGCKKKEPGAKAWLCDSSGRTPRAIRICPVEGAMARRCRRGDRTSSSRNPFARSHSVQVTSGALELALTRSRAIILGRSSLAALHSRRERPGRWRAWQRRNTTQPARRQDEGGFSVGDRRREGQRRQPEPDCGSEYS
jgi:hypothetical protein